MFPQLSGLRFSATAPCQPIKHLSSRARRGRSALDVVEVERPDDSGPAINLAKSRGAEALNVLASPMLNGSASNVAASARKADLPAMCQWREMAEAGCLSSYGPSFMEGYRPRRCADGSRPSRSKSSRAADTTADAVR